MNDFNSNITIEHVKAVVDFAIEGACNKFDYQEFLSEINEFNKELYSVEECLGIFNDNHFEEMLVDNLEGLLGEVCLLMVEYHGLSRGTIYVKAKGSTMELDRVCNETIRMCKLLVRHYTELLILVESRYDSHDMLRDDIQNQLDYFSDVILSISNINFEYAINYDTDLSYLDTDILNRCIISLSEKYGVTIYDKEFFVYNNTICKVCEFLRKAREK